MNENITKISEGFHVNYVIFLKYFYVLYLIFINIDEVNI